ncbi:hypothetical protein AB4298_01505 [Shewanella sp. 10N.261.52.F9]|uniref:hypothetical protein n=1 Tax=Shewanella TaxID=22 RepID=UPI00200E6038|nr:hypothetical protein [Shewanella marinintestina]MCL1146279.1 hypothetical protein [Shewanella marinintestina]
MALCLNMFSLPNEHICFLKAHPQTLDAYLQGELPEWEPAKQTLLNKVLQLLGSKGGQTLPSDWPCTAVVMIGPTADHRNVDLYHYILNDTEERVKGAGSLFQTWLDIHNHDAIKMDSESESFAFQSQQLPALQVLLSVLNEQTVRKRFDAWLDIHNPDYLPLEPEYQQLCQGFERFKLNLAKAIDKDLGLMWVTQ